MRYIPEVGRWSGLMRLPEGVDIGKAINDAMKSIEEANDDLKDVLPRLVSGEVAVHE